MRGDILDLILTSGEITLCYTIKFNVGCWYEIKTSIVLNVFFYSYYFY